MTPIGGRRVPALVVSGFLGSGKTTLVRHLLADAQARGLRLAIVSNEFGEVGIDRALLGGGGEAFVELGGGCVCCRLSNELVATLEKLRETVNPDRVVIETSGVALPYDVSLHLWREPLARWVGEDLTVIVVNAEQVAGGRDLDDTFEDQVTSADLILLNKVDLVAPAELPALEARLRALEPDAPILRTRHSAVSPEVLFPPGPGELAAGERARRAEKARAPHGHQQFASELRDFERGIASAALVGRLRAEGALRAKGFVETAEGLRLVQGVGPRIELVAPDFAPPRELVGRVVLIRRGAPGDD
ncbi:MAG: CobW family GTP-binding protein [Myxococcota bacterium]